MAKRVVKPVVKDERVVVLVVKMTKRIVRIMSKRVVKEVVLRVFI
jgi:hypothetical protein